MTTSQDSIIELFLQLVAIDAVSKAEKPVADFIRNYLNKREIEVFEDKSGSIVGGNSGNIIARVGNGTAPKIAFTAHMDTVKSTRGIKPQQVDGMIRTDGHTILGADNRAGIAIILHSIDRLLQSRKEFPSFEIIFTIGEETGLFGSMNLDLSILQSRIAYTLDSSADPGKYVLAAPSAWEFKIRLTGKGSHAAVNPGAGINAITMARDLLGEINTGQVDPHTTVNVGVIKGGEANNIVPESVFMSGEVRSFREESLKKYLKQIEECCRQISGRYNGRCGYEQERAFPGFHLDSNTPAIRLLEEAYQTNNLTPDPLVYHGASDANILNGRGITCIDVGIGAKNPHSFDEYIAVADLVKMSDVVLTLVQNQACLE